MQNNRTVKRIEWWTITLRNWQSEGLLVASRFRDWIRLEIRYHSPPQGLYRNQILRTNTVNSLFRFHLKQETFNRYLYLTLMGCIRPVQSILFSAFFFQLLALYFRGIFLTLAKKFFLSLNCPSNEMNGYMFRSILWPGQD